MITVRENPARDNADLADVLVAHAVLTAALDEACWREWALVKNYQWRLRFTPYWAAKSTRVLAECAIEHKKVLMVLLGIRRVLRRTQRERVRNRRAREERTLR